MNPKWAQKPLDWYLTPLGLRKDGRPIYPIAGGAPDDDGDGGDEGGDDGSDGDGDDGAGDDDGGDDGDDGDGDGDGDDLSEAEQKILTALEPQIAAMGDKIADRLVNAQQTAARKAARAKARKTASSGQSSAAKDADKAERAADLREARLSYREYVSDKITFIGTHERETATDIAKGLLATAIADGEDPDDAGRQVAEQVAKRIKAMRQQAEKAVRARLVKEGKISEDDAEKPGSQANKGPNKPGSRSEMQKGVDKAKQMGFVKDK